MRDKIHEIRTGSRLEKEKIVQKDASFFMDEVSFLVQKIKFIKNGQKNYIFLK